MRCRACNDELTDIEVTLKDENDDYMDMCGRCLEASHDTTPMETEYVQESARSGDNNDA